MAIIKPLSLSFNPILYALLADWGAGTRTTAFLLCQNCLCLPLPIKVSEEACKSGGGRDLFLPLCLTWASCLLVLPVSITATSSHPGSSSYFCSSGWMQSAILPAVAESATSCLPPRDTCLAPPEKSGFRLPETPPLSFWVAATISLFPEHLGLWLFVFYSCYLHDKCPSIFFSPFILS